MKLKELADIKQGLTIASQLFKSEKKTDGIYFPCLRAEDFSDGKSYYVQQKEFKHIKGFSRKSFLFYGDFLIYKKLNDYKLFRYDSESGQTIPTDSFFVITPDIGILKDFLGFEKNRKYFLDELKQIEKKNGKLTLDAIGDINIWTDDIKELEEADKAELYGIRKPVNIKETPIRITQKGLPFDKLIKRIKHGELLLDTEFQRRPGLWDLPIKSRLIESLIIMLPIPAFYFDGSNNDKWLVIDGLQRLSAVNDFVNDKFRLEKLDYLPELEGKLFSELERPHQRNIEEFEIFACIIEKETPVAVKYKIFKNINTSALVLKPQEIRHALNPGKPAEILKSISEKEWFAESISLSDKDRLRMIDRELVLRYLTFQIKHYTEYKPTIVEYLDNAMNELYSVPISKLKLYELELFNITHILTVLFGENPYSRLIFDGPKKHGHSNILFELLTYGFSFFSADQSNEVLKSPDKFKNRIKDYFKNKDEAFWEYEIAYTQENLIKRFKEIELLFKEK